MLDSFKIGHMSNESKSTGVTVILAPEGATGGVSVRGNAPGTRETDLLRSDALVDKVNAVTLSGGSAFGLEACCGIMKYLKEQGKGYRSGSKIVPIVCGAVLYDLDYIDDQYPTMEMGYQACKVAKSNNFQYGQIGAGTGATVGKIMGMESAEKSGLGVATANFQDTEIMAIVAVNAFGDVYDDETNQVIAGAKLGGKHVNTANMLINDVKFDKSMKNTTIGCIITNAKLTKAQANKLSDQCHNAYALCIRPVHTMLDGDTIFTMASGECDVEFIQFAEIAIQTMAKAIKKAVKK